MHYFHFEMQYVHFKISYFAAKMHVLHFRKGLLQMLRKVKYVKVRGAGRELPRSAFLRCRAARFPPS